MSWPNIGWVDIAMLGVVFLSALIGLMRGFTFELLSLAGWFVAYFAARWLEPWLAPHLPLGAPLNGIVALVSAFIAVMIAWSLLARGISALIGATPLRPLDRILGAGFGVARGLLVLLVAATVIAYTPLAASPLWRQSAGAALLDSALQRLLPVLPAALPHSRST